MRLRIVVGLSLIVVLAAGSLFAQKVRTKPGEADVSEKSGVSSVEKSRSMMFDGTEVQAYRDAPSTISIIDVGGQESEPIVLNRSFKEALKQNLDKETTERLTR